MKHAVDLNTHLFTFWDLSAFKSFMNVSPSNYFSKHCNALIGCFFSSSPIKPHLKSSPVSYCQSNVIVHKGPDTIMSYVPVH